MLEKNYGADGWWLCSLHNRQGIVPFNYVKELSYDESQACLNLYAAPTSLPYYPGPEDAIDASPSMTLVAGQQLLKAVNASLKSCEGRSADLLRAGLAREDADHVHSIATKEVDIGREAQGALRDIVSMSVDVLKTADKLQKSGEAPDLCQQLMRSIVPIKNTHGDLSSLLVDLERSIDISTTRRLLPQIHSLMSSVLPAVTELTTAVLANAVLLFSRTAVVAGQSDDNIYSSIVNEPHSGERTPQHTTRSSPPGRSFSSHDTVDGADTHQRPASCDLLSGQDESTPVRQKLVKRPSQISDIRISDRSSPSDFVVIQPGNRSTCMDTDSNASTGSRHSSSSSGEPIADATLKRRSPRSDRTLMVEVSGTQVTLGDLSESELTLLAYYAERMETLIPSVTNAVEAFCRAISEKQVPKQFVWHSKMVVVGAYKMVYVADTVFQKLAHAELRNHIVACSNRLVDSIKNIVEFTKVAAQQYPSVGAMRDMVESVSHLPPLALDLAESIKDAASLR